MNTTKVPPDFPLTVMQWYRGWHYGQKVNIFGFADHTSLSQPLNSAIIVQSSHRQYRNEWVFLFTQKLFKTHIQKKGLQATLFAPEVMPKTIQNSTDRGQSVTLLG